MALINNTGMSFPVMLGFVLWTSEAIVLAMTKLKNLHLATECQEVIHRLLIVIKGMKL